MGFGALGVVLSYLGAKMAPRPLQEGLGTAFGRFFIDFGRFLDQFWSIFGTSLIDFLNLFDRCLDKCFLMFQHILVIVLSALLDVWAYVGHVAHVPLSSNPQARWRGWPEGQLDIYTCMCWCVSVCHRGQCIAFVTDTGAFSLLKDKSCNSKLMCMEATLHITATLCKT